MAYNTRYSLAVRHPSGNPLANLEAVQKAIENNPEARWALDDWNNNEPAFGEPVTWYDWEKDLKAWSTRFPGLTFVLHGIGECHEHWRAFAKDGKVVKQEAKLAYPMEPEL